MLVDSSKNALQVPVGLLSVENSASLPCFYNHIWMQMNQNILLFGDRRPQNPSHLSCALQATGKMKKPLDFQPAASRFKPQV